ncbi:hypothetical protein [Lichenicola sp.]
MLRLLLGLAAGGLAAAAVPAIRTIADQARHKVVVPVVGGRIADLR